MYTTRHRQLYVYSYMYDYTYSYTYNYIHIPGGPYRIHLEPTWVNKDKQATLPVILLLPRLR